MAKWKEKSRANLLSLSLEKQDCLTSAQEWEFNGNIIDHGHSKNRCELCEGENLRHHFQIVNIKNDNLLWVGSSCIHKFDILVRDDSGQEIGDIKKKKNYLNNKLADKKREYFLDSLRSLWKTVDDSEKFVVERVGKSCRDKESIYPELAVDFLRINQKYNTDIEYSHIKVSARASYNIDSIARMPVEDRTLLFKVLSKKQIERVNRTVLQFKIDAEREIEHNAYLDELALRKSKRQTQKPIDQPTVYKSTRTDIYVMPEYITCSVCGKYTKDSACFNPDMCRDCIGKKQWRK